ncbi:hypothetical protein K443DRAFT_683687 [Laccaria amethystina LaAM-08-1]|uniref:Uncharacterized protein n=1 Tax=Laccaria amethystina LaAM-08-1 TaxID=1095629 RepID=A0A0C9XEH6_9AGAR|nr:hypothetical protein K443DRAFT_683687 [Laccaria amethystina LaAM-08-1]
MPELLDDSSRLWMIPIHSGVVGITRMKCSDLFQKISNFYVHPELQDTRQPY